MAKAIVVMEPSGVIYSKLFRPGSGPDRHIRGKAVDVAIRAVMLAPTRSGRLKKSIRVDQSREPTGRFSFGYAVSANAPYAGHVHQGTGPSIRFADHKMMRFLGTNADSGRTVFTKYVFHPGTPSNPFLERALTAMVD
jgi:hypothetical protein